MSDFQKFKELEKGRIGSSNEGNVAANAGVIVGQMHTREQSFPLAVQANGNANIAESLLAVMPYTGKFVSGNVTVPANIAANATNYSLLTVLKRTAGAASVVVATANLANVAVTAWTPLALTVANAANALVTAGDTMSYTLVGVGGPGVVIAAAGSAAILDLAYEDI